MLSKYVSFIYIAPLADRCHQMHHKLETKDKNFNLLHLEVLDIERRACDELPTAAIIAS